MAKLLLLRERERERGFTKILNSYSEQAYCYHPQLSCMYFVLPGSSEFLQLTSPSHLSCLQKREAIYHTGNSSQSQGTTNLCPIDEKKRERTIKVAMCVSTLPFLEKFFTHEVLIINSLEMLNLGFVVDIFNGYGRYSDALFISFTSWGLLECIIC